MIPSHFTSCFAFLNFIGKYRATQIFDMTMVKSLDLSNLWPHGSDRQIIEKGLLDPYIALSMLDLTLGKGFRGNPLHLRPSDQDDQVLTGYILSFVTMHLRIRKALPELVDWPEEGLNHKELQGDGGWCDLCGQCCCHSGTVPHTPRNIHYPAFFYHVLSGHSLAPQPYCAFLFQAKGKPLYFCSLHPIKPIACRVFDKKDCALGKSFRSVSYQNAASG